MVGVRVQTVVVAVVERHLGDEDTPLPQPRSGGDALERVVNGTDLDEAIAQPLRQQAELS